MSKYIRFCSNRICDAVALSIVCRATKTDVFVKRTAPFTKYWINNPFIQIIDQFEHNTQTIIINELGNDFKYNCSLISNLIGGAYSANLISSSELKYLKKVKLPYELNDKYLNVLIYNTFASVPINPVALDISLDSLCKYNYNFFTCGTFAYPCIRRSIDFRGLDELSILLQSPISRTIILTNSNDFKILSEGMGYNNVVIITDNTQSPHIVSSEITNKILTINY